jgi:chromosomal replication initiator protein
MNDFWQHCLAFFAKELGQQQFVTWIQPLQCNISGLTVTVTAPNRFVQRWVRDRFHARILDIARERLGENASVDLVISEKTAAASPVAGKAQTESPARPAAATPVVRDVSRL